MKTLLGVSTLAALSLLTAQVSVAAREPDYSCYMQIGSRRVVDLTRSICRFNADEAAKAAKRDAAYLAAIQKVMQNQSEPWLNKLATNNADLLTGAAREFCEARQAGQSTNQFMERKYTEIMRSEVEFSTTGRDRAAWEQRQQDYQIRMVALSLATAFAPQHYCPEIASRPGR
jgi:hypothetical protein